MDKNAKIFCIDCLGDGKKCSCDYSTQYLGHVCPRCERIYSDLLPGNHLAYTTKKAMIRRLSRDEKERAKFIGVFHQALHAQIKRN